MLFHASAQRDASPRLERRVDFGRRRLDARTFAPRRPRRSVARRGIRIESFPDTLVAGLLRCERKPFLVVARREEARCEDGFRAGREAGADDRELVS